MLTAIYHLLKDGTERRDLGTMTSTAVPHRPRPASWQRNSCHWGLMFNSSRLPRQHDRIRNTPHAHRRTDTGLQVPPL